MIEGCPHGPSKAGDACGECADDRAHNEALEDRLATKLVALEEEMAKIPAEIRERAAKLANERLNEKLERLTAIRWGHAPDNRTERWHGVLLTREDAIAEGRIEHGGSGFWIARGIKCDPAQFMPDADDLVQTMASNAGDNAGEVAEDWPDAVSKEAEAELTEFLAAWARKHIPCEFWIADGHEEEIEP